MLLKKQLLTKTAVMTALTGLGLAVGGLELYDRTFKTKHNPLDKGFRKKLNKRLAGYEKKK